MVAKLPDFNYGYRDEKYNKKDVLGIPFKIPGTEKLLVTVRGEGLF